MVVFDVFVSMYNRMTLLFITPGWASLAPSPTTAHRQVTLHKIPLRLPTSRPATIVPNPQKQSRNLTITSTQTPTPILPISPPRPLTTTEHTYTDPRGKTWTYESDTLSAAEHASSRAPIVCLHASSGLGVNRSYWDRLLSVLSDRPDALCQHAISRFDWVGTGSTQPKEHRLTTPYNADFFAAQVDHFAATFQQPVIIVCASASESVAVRFAACYPHRIAALVIVTGLGTKSMTQVPRQRRCRLSYGALSGRLGDAFWALVRNRRYISSFSRKNILAGDTWETAWVDRSMQGSVDARIRFVVFSFLSGYLFGDFTEDFRKIGVPCAFFAHTLGANTSIANRVGSVRPPVPIVANEASFREDGISRMEFRVSVIPNCVGVVVEGAGYEMFFEHTEQALPKLEEFVSSLY